MELGFTVCLITPEKISLARLEQVADLTGANDLASMRRMTLKDHSSAFDVLISFHATVPESLYACSARVYNLVNERPRQYADNNDGIISLHDNCIIDLQPGLVGKNIAIKAVIRPLRYSKKLSKTIIVSEGAFISGAGDNGQKRMIKAFGRIVKPGGDGELHFVGMLPCELKHRDYFIECQEMAKGLPVYFHMNANKEKRDSVFQIASLYWHDSVSEQIGLSVLEAMSAGAIPIIAQPGIAATNLRVGVDGFYFTSEDELLACSKRVIEMSDDIADAFRTAAVSHATDFSPGNGIQFWRSLLMPTEYGSGDQVG